MRTTNTLTPIPLAPAVPAIAKALELIGLGGAAAAAAAAASDSDSYSIGLIDTGATTWDLVKPMLQIGANKAGDFLSSIPGEYGNQMRRFLAMSSPRPVTIEDVIKPTYVHAGWNRINGGYSHYDPNLGMTTETYIDPVIINGTYASPYDPTASLRVEPTIKTTPLVNTVQGLTPIELSSGRVVTLPTVFTDYRVFDESVEGDSEGVVDFGTGAGTGTVTVAGGGSPRRNDDDDDKDNQISSVEEYIRRFGKNMNWRTARRIRKFERISHDANGNINPHATKLLNRGVNAGTEGAKTGGFSWQTLLFGTSLGVEATLGTQAILGGKEEVKDPELHGKTDYQRIDSLVNAAQDITGLSEQTETPPIQGEDIDWSKIKI